MNDRSPIPEPIPEQDLLDLVEGELDASRAADLEGALAKHPAAARLVAQMRQDRTALRALADAGPAPADIADRVQAALERRTLLAISDGESLLDSPPVSIVVPNAQRRSGFFAQDRVGRRLALAAGLLLTLGVGAFVATRLFSPPSSHTLVGGNEPIADALTRDTAPHEPGPAETTIAAAPKPDPASESLTADESIALAAAPPEISAEIADDIAQPELPTERAVELLRAGRLALRVSGDERSAMRVGALSRPAETNARRWRLAGLASPEVARRLEPLAAPIPLAWASARDEPLWAGVDTLPWVSPAIVEWPDASPELRVMVADIRIEPDAIESLRDSLAKVGPVEFVELPTAIPDEPGPVDAADLLWWTQPPSAWTPRARVPVVVVPDRG